MEREREKKRRVKYEENSRHGKTLHVNMERGGGAEIEANFVFNRKKYSLAFPSGLPLLLWQHHSGGVRRRRRRRRPLTPFSPSLLLTRLWPTETWPKVVSKLFFPSPLPPPSPFCSFFLPPSPIVREKGGRQDKGWEQKFSLLPLKYAKKNYCKNQLPIARSLSFTPLFLLILHGNSAHFFQRSHCFPNTSIKETVTRRTRLSHQ